MTFLGTLLRLFLLGLLGATWLLAGIYLYLSPTLPDVETLRDVRLQTPMKVYTSDGELIGQFGEQKRNPVGFDEIPEQFVKALLAAEDDRFFEHQGIDPMGLLRAVSELVLTGKKGSGGSTLTMQVARNYFLSLERTFTRKFKEILLALEIERALTKDEIFELYVNRIFLGHRAYGFDAAAQVYYGRHLRELELPQFALLAGIPKAPSRRNPLTDPDGAKARRNWILGRMRGLGFITEDEARAAASSQVIARHYGARLTLQAPYAAEMARQRMLNRYGLSAYNDGFSVYTTVDSRLQRRAQQAVNRGLAIYDSRHGYRGPEQQLPDSPGEDRVDNWLAELNATPVIAGLQPAVVTEILEQSALALLPNGAIEEILWDNGLSQARPYLTENSRGAAPVDPSEVLAVGDLVRIDRNETGEPVLSQLPEAQAALVALTPDTGSIITVVGGMGFERSKFNRATQAQRQPGSSFKPFVYSAGLASGSTAASLINDAPLVFEDSSLEDIWRPENDGGKFYGPTRLRWALTKSRNLVSIRLLQQLGIRNMLDYAERFGFDTSSFPEDLSLALGSHAMTPLQVATAYAVLANGGYQVEPYLIDRIEDLEGNILYQAEPAVACIECEEWDGQAAYAEDELSIEEILAGASTSPVKRAPRVMDARVNFIIDSILKDVITRGTGRRALALERGDIGGKTGTTNGPADAWFSGYNPDVVATAWVGFDDYQKLGKREFGGTAALPIWIEFMGEALQDRPERYHPQPPGLVNVRIDPDNGLLAQPGQENAIFEYFREEFIPTEHSQSRGAGAGNSGTEDLIRDIF